MTDKKKIFAICGSTRQNSSNHSLLHAIATICADKIDMNIFEDLAALPAFNPDDRDNLIPGVAQFRKQISEADGVIICTPEYAHGVPGALKNAIDWTVASNEFYHKPTVLITASTDGTFGHSALLETLRTIGTKNTDQLQLLIEFVKTRMGRNNTITDSETLSSIKELINNLIISINEQEI